MTQFGCTMMCEQARPDQLVRELQQAEAAGFDFPVTSLARLTGPLGVRMVHPGRRRAGERPHPDS